MKSLTAGYYRFILSAGFLLVPSVAAGHERFIEHDLIHPLHIEFFRHLDPNMLLVALRVSLLLAVMLFVWFLRDSLCGLFEYFPPGKLAGRTKERLHRLFRFFTDKPIHHPWFTQIGEWAVGFFLRAPALVLMYSATTDSLLIPSYPLNPATALFFKFMQLIIAMGILTQVFLPLWGAIILGTFFYLIYAYDWKSVVDFVCFLSVVAVYLSLPWKSYSQNIGKIGPSQIRWMRIIMGFGFIALGWMKIYNYDLTAGFADNYPWILADPLIRLTFAGTDPAFLRESWIIGFALAEVLGGFAIMMGVFVRLWSVLLITIMIKFIVVDFGWGEIPHLSLIAGFMVLLFSNHSPRSTWAGEAGKFKILQGGSGFKGLTSAVSAMAVSALVIFPLLYLLTFIERS